MKRRRSSSHSSNALDLTFIDDYPYAQHGPVIHKRRLARSAGVADLSRSARTMFRFFKKQSSPKQHFDYNQEWQRLQNAYADPAIELAKTKQAVVVSAASVLDRLWNGNGGLGWGASCEEDYVAPLREHLISDAQFTDEERAALSLKLDEVVAVGAENLRRIAAAGDEETTLESCVDVDYIVDRSIEWCMRHPDPIPLSSEEEYRGHD